eukprot:748509-Hanusia_phi.AAC.5
MEQGRQRQAACRSGRFLFEVRAADRAPLVREHAKTIPGEQRKGERREEEQEEGENEQDKEGVRKLSAAAQRRGERHQVDAHKVQEKLRR